MSSFYNSQWFKYQDYRISPTYTPRLLIQAESAGFENALQDHRQRIVIGGTEVVNANAPRSYLLSQLRRVGNTWSLIASNGYDVYGDPTAANNAGIFLQGFQPYDLLILNTWDEPYNNVSYIQPTLINSFGSNMGSYPRVTRDAHLLIAVKDKGVIFEQWRTRYSNAIYFSGWIP